MRNSSNGFLWGPLMRSLISGLDMAITPCSMSTIEDFYTPKFSLPRNIERTKRAGKANIGQKGSGLLDFDFRSFVF